MTTLGYKGELLAHFDGKSPRDSYAQTCREKSVHLQRQVFNMLPNSPNTWNNIRRLDLSNALLGARGCMTILPLVTLSGSLQEINLKQCGLSDDFVKELCSALQSHSSVRDVDISSNRLVTVKSAAHIIGLMRNNANMIRFDVTDTHVGVNINKIIAGLAAKNQKLVREYYQDKYFKMKDLFNYLDANGIGWVQLKALLANCPYPVLQERFSERIAVMKPQKRSDNTISFNTFLELVYMNYKNEKEITQYAEGKINESYLFTLANWFEVIEATKRYNNSKVKSSIETDAAPADTRNVVLPDNLHRLRIRDFLLTHRNADKLVTEAIKLAKTQEKMDKETKQERQADEKDEAESGSENLDTVGDDGSLANENAAQDAASIHATIDETLVLPVTCLLAARKALFHSHGKALPRYTFFKERHINDVSPHACNKSNLFEMEDSMTSKTMRNVSSSHSGVDDAENGDEPHTFSLPPMLVKMIIEFFNTAVSKLPPKKVTSVPETPRSRRDRAMEKVAIPIATFLSAKFVTDLEKVEPRLLADYFARYALPIDDSSITLQEMVNVLDELYVACRIDCPISLEDILHAENPLTNPEYADFFTQHLQSCYENVSSYIPSRRPTYK